MNLSVLQNNILIRARAQPQVSFQDGFADIHVLNIFYLCVLIFGVLFFKVSFQQPCLFILVYGKHDDAHFTCLLFLFVANKQ